MKTKRVNVFNQEIREIRCVSNTFDYFGDGTVFTEDKLEVGTMYTLIKAEIHPYGRMVYLKEIENKYGFQDFLFEEFEEYNLEEYEKNYENWLLGKLEIGMEDAKAGRIKSASEVFQEIREKYGFDSGTAKTK